MKKFIFVTLFVLAYCHLQGATAHDGDFFKVLCSPLNENEIHVQLTKETTKLALKSLQDGGVDVFRSFMKTKLKNILQLNHTCLGGSISEIDYNTGVAMFAAGHEEFSYNAKLLEGSKYRYLYMMTMRSKEYDPYFNHFHLGGV